MLPMGWNQIRQVRVPDVPPQAMPYGQPQQMMPNQQQYDMYHPPPMIPQHQMFPQQMMGNFGLHGAPTMMNNPQKPPEPEGPPPPSPPAPLPTGEVIPPPPPDDGKWWESETKNLPNKQQKVELERMVGEKWFQSMTTSQQIECWQHKLQLLNKQKKDVGSTQVSKPPPIVPAPLVSAPSTNFKPPNPPVQSGNVGQELLKVREEETRIKQQVLTFERQYGEWKKQFDDWKDKHKSHPNKQQFAQYEGQWMTWQKQMSSQKNEYETNLKRIQDKIKELEQQKSEKLASGDSSDRPLFDSPGFKRPSDDSLLNQQTNRFPGPQTPLQQNPMQSREFNKGPRFGRGFNTEQRPRFDGPPNHGESFTRPQFGDNQSSFNKRSMFDNNQGQGFGHRPPFCNDQDPGFNEASQFDNDQEFNQGPQFRNERGPGYNPRFNDSQNIGFNQRPRFNTNQVPRFSQRPQFDSGQDSVTNENFGSGPGQRPGFSPPRSMDSDSFQQRGPGLQAGNQRPRFSDNPALRFFENQNQNEGPRQRFPGPRPRGPRFGAEWQAHGPRPRGPAGPRFGNKFPQLMDEQETGFGGDWQGDEHVEEESYEEEFFGSQELRGPPPGFGPRGGMRGRFPGPRQRPPRPGSMGENPRFRGPRPRFPNSGPRGRFPGPSGLLPLPQDEEDYAEDDLPETGNFFTEESKDATEKEDKTEEDEKTSQKQDTTAEEKDINAEDWNVTRDMVPLEFGSKPKQNRKNKHQAFTLHDAIKDDEGDQSATTQVEKSEEDSNSKKEENRPEDDYSHYDTDKYMLEMERPPPRLGRDLPLRGRGRGGRHPFRGRGAGFPDPIWDRGRDFGNEFLLDDILLREEERAENIRRATRRGILRGARRGLLHGSDHRDLLESSRHDLLDDLVPAREFPRRDPSEARLSSRETSAANSSKDMPETTASSALDTQAIMQKAKELSSLDIKNLLSAVKSINGSDALKSEETAANTSISSSAEGNTKDLPETTARDEEAELLARERHYEELARGFEDPSFCSPESSLDNQLSRDQITDLAGQLGRNRTADSGLGRLLGRERIMDSDLIAAGLDPMALELRDENLLLQDYLLNSSLRDPIRQAPRRDLLLDPLLQESYLERDLLMREIQQMRKREEARQREEALREKELRESLTKPILQAQKIVETIDYSHGLKDKGKEEGKPGERRGSPGRDTAFRGRGPYPNFEDERRRFPPTSMDERMRMRERGLDDRHPMDRRFPHPMDERMLRERGPLRPRRSSSPYDPTSSVVVADDVGEALQKHWQLLDRDRESMERKRHSMERRRNSLEKTRSSREREEERRDRERSLERLHRMERELKERERMLNEREKRLKSPKRSRDMRDRSSWKPEGGNRPRTPPKRRYEEEGRLRDRDRRFRSPSPHRVRARSPFFERRGRSPRDRSPRRSPIKDRRRFTSPSGDPSRVRSPRPPRPKEMKPVCVRAEDLLNDPARQQRPKRIVIILRGLPGSGKSHIAKLIRDKESAKGVTPRLLGLDDYFMVENEKFEKDPDTGKIVKRKVHEYEYEAAMEPRYRESLLKAFKKTLEDGFFNFIIVDAVNDKVSHFSEFWTAAKKCVFEVYVAELTADVHVCVKRNTHKRELSEIQEISKNWEATPAHMIRLDVRQMLQDSEIQEVEMGDVSDDEKESDNKRQKMTPEQMAGLPQSKWELMEANERTRLDKLDGIKKKKPTTSQQDMAEFLSVTDDYVQRSSAPGKKRVRWADIEERSTQQRLREVGFVVGQTDWNRLVDGSIHAEAALNRTKFI